MIRHYLLKPLLSTTAFYLSLCCTLFAQVDTTYIYNTSTSFGTLDIRLRKSSTRYYYLQENKTFSYRESSPGVKSGTFRDMTSWDSSPYSQGNLREKNGSSDYFVLNYRLLFPVSYNAAYAKGYPLIVMMHGAGERGNCWNSDCYHADASYNPNTNNPAAPATATSELLNNDHNLLHGGKIHLDARNLAGSKLPDDPTLSSRAFPGFVLFAQNMNGWGSSTVQDAIRLVRLISKKYNIDENRIYIHGLSNGGVAVYEAIKRAPWLFAAALPMSAPGDGGIFSQNQVANVAHIPLWTFQGGQDNLPTPSKTEGYVKKFRDAGAIIRYSLYPSIGHGTWNTAYKEPDFFKWILSKNKSDIHLFGGSPAICMTNGQGVRMELAKGFRAYQWERNGVIISGATSASYVASSTGTYRVRFSRKPNPGASDWNEWSDPVTVTSQNPSKAQIAQTGTVKLKDLNFFNSLKINSVGEAAHYYWYKNGVLVNLSGSVDDTVRYVTLSSTFGNGQYTLVTTTDDGCPSPTSDPVHAYFSDSAPISITAPSNLTGQSSSLNTVSLNWTDASANETGFEVWRRKVTGTSTYTKWEMRGLTGVNIKTFVDNGTEPSSTYHYKIRAVNNTARSNYAPSNASTSYLVVNTMGDSQSPSIPQTLTAATTGINTVKLSWKASADNTGIRQYVIYYSGKAVGTGSTATSHTLNNLTLNTNYSFTVKAEDLGGNLSAASNAATASTVVSGVYYEHSTGAWQNLDQINWTGVPEFTGHLANFSLTPRTQEDYFNFKFDGYLYINTGGTYQFRTTSSDGSRVELDNVVVLNNDGIQGTTTITGANQSLTAGPKRIVVKYFEYDGSHTLTVYYKGPDTNNTWLKIPDSALRSGSASGSTMMASAESESVEVMDSVVVSPLVANVYPNPASQNDLNLRVETASERPVVVRIVDFSGREVYRSEFRPEEVAAGIQILPSAALYDGLYIMMINQGDEIVRERISIKN
jgi:hypothetical protein